MRNQLFLIIVFGIVVFASCKTTQPIAVKQETKQFIKSCADSINIMKPGDPAPSFVFNACLDRQSQYWPNLHTPIPVRKLIVNRVTNREAMLYILSLQDARLKEACMRTDTATNKLRYYQIPYIQLSFYDLFYNRLSELHNKMRY
jgi:hypothetical protein